MDVVSALPRNNLDGCFRGKQLGMQEQKGTRGGKVPHPHCNRPTFAIGSVVLTAGGVGMTVPLAVAIPLMQS